MYNLTVSARRKCHTRSRRRIPGCRRQRVCVRANVVGRDASSSARSADVMDRCLGRKHHDGERNSFLFFSDCLSQVLKAGLRFHCEPKRDDSVLR